MSKNIVSISAALLIALGLIAFSSKAHAEVAPAVDLAHIQACDYVQLFCPDGSAASLDQLTCAQSCPDGSQPFGPYELPTPLPTPIIRRVPLCPKITLVCPSGGGEMLTHEAFATGNDCKIMPKCPSPYSEGPLIPLNTVAVSYMPVVTSQGQTAPPQQNISNKTKGKVAAAVSDADRNAPDYFLNGNVPLVVEKAFKEVFGRDITPSESTYWKMRARTSKPTISKLRGAMLWHRLHGITH